MKVIKRKNKKYYKYEKRSFSSNIKISIIFFIIAIFIFTIDVLLCYAYKGEAPLVAGGLGVVAILLDITSMVFIIIDIYVDRNFQPAIRNMLILQILYLIMWIIII